ncbi:MAG: ComEC/Rec2 family competence protein [bacterium]|nr:ComEC/Rec2 family competence protein [bacterium]
MRRKYFFSFIISFVVGVAFESVFNFGYSLALLCTALAFFVCFTPRVRSQAGSVLFVSLLLFGFAVGVARVDVSQENSSTNSLDSMVGKVTQIEGVVVDEPDVREEYTNVVVQTGVTNEQSRILVRAPIYPELKYGDEVLVVGKITGPKNFAPKDGAKYFDYESYLAKDNIHYQMYFPKISVVSHGNGNVIREKLFVLKAWLMKNISENISEPEASLAGGITLGAKQSLGKELMQKFRDVGVAHIVVLSGYNIAVVAGIFSRLVMFMPFSIRLIMSGFGVVLFAVMVGGGATVIRATAMALVVILARMLGREGDALRVLLLVGGLMVLVNPMILLHDVSFQLSFSATLAIVVLVPILEKYFTFISSRTLREIVVITFATQIFVLPLILYHMGSASLVGFIANVFILPVVPLAMLLVALVAIFAWVPILGSFFAFGSYALLAYIFMAVDFFARVPFASLSGISFPLWGLLLTYIFLGYYIIKNYSIKPLGQK